MVITPLLFFLVENKEHNVNKLKKVWRPLVAHNSHIHRVIINIKMAPKFVNTGGMSTGTRACPVHSIKVQHTGGMSTGEFGERDGI